MLLAPGTGGERGSGADLRLQGFVLHPDEAGALLHDLKTPVDILSSEWVFGHGESRLFS